MITAGASGRVKVGMLGSKAFKNVGDQPGSGAEPGRKVNVFFKKMRHLCCATCKVM